MTQKLKNIFCFGILMAMMSPLWAGDADIKLTTTDGSTKFTIQDSGSVEVASVTSNGDAYFNSLTQVGTGGNLIQNRSTLQSGATFYVSSGTVQNQFMVGNIFSSSSGGAGTDNYIAFPFTSGGVIAAKNVVVINAAGQVVTTAVASSNTVVGIAVTAASGSGQTVMVAVQGIVTGVTCQVVVQAGARVCTGVTNAGRIGTCASTTNDSYSIGKMLTTCTAGGTGTMFVDNN